VDVEGENVSGETIELYSLTLTLGTDSLYIQYTFTVDNVLYVTPGQSYQMSGEWEPAIQGWPDGSTTLIAVLGDTNGYLVGCTDTSVNISAMTLGLATALLVSLNS